MTSTVARLVLAMLLLPATGAVFLLSFVAIIRPPGPPNVAALLAVWATTYAFVAVYWVMLWRDVVRWTWARLIKTAGITLLSLGIALAFGTAILALGRWAPVQLAILIGGGMVPIAWVLGTVLIWRETSPERTRRLAALGATVLCPLCGYNLAGLVVARCPECGGTFTLDQLAAAQPRAETELTE